MSANYTPQNDIPTAYGGGNQSASANASIQVYTEQGMGVTEDFKPSGNMGYNMTQKSSSMGYY